jgi:hypothetical protein
VINLKKKPPERSPGHLVFIRRLPCLKCGAPEPSEAAHLRSGTDAGMGMKPGDNWTLPLCHQHHAEQHRIGEETFWNDRLDMVKEIARKLWLYSGDIWSGVHIVMEGKCSIFS